MNIKEFGRLKVLQRKTWTVCTVYVQDIGDVEQAPHGGCQQRIQLILGEGVPTTEMTYYFSEPDHRIENYEDPNQKFKIMWMKKDDGGYWKCLPIEPKPVPQDEDLEQVAVDRQVLIVRQTCIKAACEFYKGCGGSSGAAIATAKIFEHYVMTGEINERKGSNGK